MGNQQQNIKYFNSSAILDLIIAFQHFYQHFVAVDSNSPTSLYNFYRNSLSLQLDFIIFLLEQMNLYSDLKANTIPKQFSSKTLTLNTQEDQKQAIKKYFLQTYSVYQKLFEYIGQDRAFYIKAEPLRHPLIFYYGHTACLYVNKFLDYGLITSRVNEQFEKMFSVGVDEMDWDDLNESHYAWPTVEQTRDYRERVKEMVINVIQKSPQEKIDNWLSNLWIILLNIEHERIHLQTSCAIMRRVPLEMMKAVEQFTECQHRQLQASRIPNNRLIEVPSWKSSWTRQKQNITTYGWDNQFGVKQFCVQSFKASEMLVSNGEYLAFVIEGGYEKEQYWTEQGKRWITAMKPTLPIFWHYIDNKYKLRLMAKLIDMPWDWPAEVNNLEARAFCKWKSIKTGKKIRLPTQDEYYAVRDVLKADQPDWQYQSVGNINMEYWMSPNPVNMFKTGNFYDVVGNVWQHTITPLYPFQNFQVHPVYQDFTIPCFDDRHDILKGGSFISTGNEALLHARYAFRRHFYQFAGFRYIQSAIQLEYDLHSEEVISDKNVEMNLAHHYLNDNSYVMEVVDIVNNLVEINKGEKNKKILTVGCSVGRIPLELSKTFKTSIGIDYTTRYFQMSIRLKNDKMLKIKDIDIDLEKMGINPDKIQLYQMNPENPDDKKINNCDWILIDGFSIKKGRIHETVKKILKLASRQATIVILNVSGLNSLSKQEGKDLIGSNINGYVQIGEEYILEASHENQSYLPNTTQQLQFRLNFYKISEP